MYIALQERDSILVWPSIPSSPMSFGLDHRGAFGGVVVEQREREREREILIK